MVFSRIALAVALGLAGTTAAQAAIVSFTNSTLSGAASVLNDSTPGYAGSNLCAGHGTCSTALTYNTAVGKLTVTAEDGPDVDKVPAFDVAAAPRCRRNDRFVFGKRHLRHLNSPSTAVCDGTSDFQSRFCDGTLLDDPAGDAEAADFNNCAGHERCLRVVAETQAVPGARGDGNDVL